MSSKVRLKPLEKLNKSGKRIILIGMVGVSSSPSPLPSWDESGFFSFNKYSQAVLLHIQ